MQDEVDLQDFAISDEYFSCHVNELFDLLALKVVDFVKKEGRWECKVAMSCFSCVIELSLQTHHCLLCDLTLQYIWFSIQWVSMVSTTIEKC